MGDRTTTADVLLRIADLLTVGRLDQAGQAQSLRVRAATILALLNAAEPIERSVRPGGQDGGDDPT
jgi:hypothetical protein